MSNDDKLSSAKERTSNSPEPDASEAGHQKRVRLRFPIAVVIFAALAHAGLWAWADEDLSVVGGGGLVIWVLATLTIAVWFALFSGVRRIYAVGSLILAALTFAVLFRWDGQTGDFIPKFAFRFSPTSEQRVAEYFETQKAASRADRAEASGRLEITKDDWPRFGGADKDQIVRGLTIRKDWDAKPPQALWRHPVGPAWSSFAVVGNLAFTQEQRSDQEAVVCYEIETGDQIWIHTDDVRFEESASGIGPRATPTVHDSRLYALGATGILNCLNPLTGDVLWSRNVVEDAGTALGMYGMSGSPLIHEDLVIVSPGGEGGAIAAYDRINGERRWSGGSHTRIYASPIFTILDDVPQLLIYSDAGVAGYELGSAKQLWLYEFTNVTGLNLAQPIVLPDESVFISAGYGSGSALLDVKQDDGGWQVEEKWVTPNRFKLKFNGGIYHDGYFYGLDEGILSCIDASDGQRQWKKGRYRFGQMLMVDGDLLVVTERGEVVLVEATPTGTKEIGRFQAIEGKTWNHPVLNRGLLLVRNGEEAACYDLRSD